MLYSQGRAFGCAKIPDMRVWVGDFDLNQQQPIFGVGLYAGARVLIRRGPSPLGWVWIENSRGADVFSELAITAAAESQLERLDTPPLADPPEGPHISVVVCTRDRPLALRSCLESLQALDYPASRYEVIVIDNASREATTRKLALQAGFNYVREEKPGLDNARNCGAASASYDIVAYTDDDVRVDPGWLKGVARGFAHGDSVCVTGLICPLELETPAQQLFEQYGGMGKGMQPKLTSPARLPASAILAAHNVGVGANMAYLRSTIRDMGGFDPDLDVGTPSAGAGDLDMFHRLLASGHSIRYEPSALVWHQHRRAMPGLHKQIYNNGRSFGCYLLKAAANRTTPRSEVFRFAVRNWIGGWLLGSLFSRQPGRNFTLVAAETWGAMHAPWAYLTTFNQLPWSRRSGQP
jgi:glycosyltransferase involved in cell wall biosynthesis